MPPPVGFIGLGLMGLPMARRLLNAGYPLTVNNRKKDKAAELLAAGAYWSDSPAGVAGRSEIVFTMLSNSEVLEEASLGSNGVIKGLKKNSIHIDHSTVSPEITRRLAKEYHSKGLSFLHSPVLGSVPQATDGTLLLFVGGEEGAFKRVESVLKILGSRIWGFEKVDQASHAKLLCNFFIAGMISTLSQALVFATKAGVNPGTLLEIIGQSHLNAPMYQTKGASIIERNFNPRFFLEHMLKDIGLVVEAAESIGVAMPTAEVAKSLFKEAMKSGLGKEDYSAVVKVLEKAAGVEVRR